jgi:nucleoprotein TPR
VQALTNQLAEQDATYSQEAAGLKRLVKMLEDRENSAKAIVERIEGDWAAVNERTGAREAVLREEVEEATARAQKAEKQVQHLNGLLRRMESGELQLPGTGGSMPGTPAFGTPARNASFGDGMFGLSPTVALASRTQKSGKTFTEVYSEYVKLQEEFAQKSVEYEHMEVTLSNVLAQIEERVCRTHFGGLHELTFDIVGSYAGPAACRV